MFVGFIVVDVVVDVVNAVEVELRIRMSMKGVAYLSLIAYAPKIQGDSADVCETGLGCINYHESKFEVDCHFEFTLILLY